MTVLVRCRSRAVRDRTVGHSLTSMATGPALRANASVKVTRMWHRRDHIRTRLPRRYLVVIVTQLRRICWLVDSRMVGDETTAGRSIRMLRQVRTIPCSVIVDRHVRRRIPACIRVGFGRTAPRHNYLEITAASNLHSVNHTGRNTESPADASPGGHLQGCMTDSCSLKSGGKHHLAAGHPDCRRGLAVSVRTYSHH